jgi:hypothetical protein
MAHRAHSQAGSIRPRARTRVRPNASDYASPCRRQLHGVAARPPIGPGWGGEKRGKRKILCPNRHSRRVIERGEDPVACSHA